MFLVIILLTCSSVVQGEDACSTKLCLCGYNTAYCSHRNLTYIPIFPKRITRLVYKYNKLHSLNATTFLNISKIGYLSLRRNHIRHIDQNVWQNLSQVYVLDLSYNKLTTSSLRNLFKGVPRNSNLSRVFLKGNQLETIPYDLLKDFKLARLAELDISHNNIRHVNLSTVQPVQELSLTYNRISTIMIGISPNLRVLLLSKNNFRDLPNFCENKTFLSNLNTLIIHNNEISSFFPDYLNCIKNLLYLDLTLNSIEILETDSFHSFKSLHWLSVEQQRSPSPLSIQRRAFNNTNLRVLYLAKNLLTDSRLDKDAFAGCSQLKKVELSANPFNLYNMEKLNDALAPLTSLQELMLHQCRLSTIPNVIGQKLHKLRLLDIGFNAITSWPDNFFEQNYDLREIDLKKNSLQKITPKMFPKPFRERLKNITLNDNPFACNCELVWFIEWIHRETHIFNEYPYGYKCLNITERICLNNTGVFISVTTVTCFFIFVIFIMSVIYKYIWHIKYHIYMWRYRPRELLDIAEKHFVYDVFVAYCVEDSVWVRDNLVPILEEGENIKLCIHQRDFQGGRLIMDNIVQHMENSRKILVVLSNDFARSKWCQFEMSLAQKLVIDMSIESIVVVLLENIATVNMSESLNALLKSTTYIAWDDDEGLFWEQIKRTLKNSD
ncbi:toll-like receptor 13 [Patella vulgata]|uniref:toll-like receptor 13 n=1 Tax=Patella vulgata TaxID=6465 RepID=UPI00217F5EFC|nr:toll-like receptor 13 [Patella vulgata]